MSKAARSAGFRGISVLGNLYLPDDGKAEDEPVHDRMDVHIVIKGVARLFVEPEHAVIVDAG